MRGSGTLLMVAVLLSAACSDEAFVEKIVINDPTEYGASVEVRGDGGGWTPLATVGGNSERQVEAVHERGDSWIFRFSYAGYEEEHRLARSELAANGWEVVVPESFASELRARGVIPPP